MCHPVGCEWHRYANGSAETTAKEGYGVTLGKPLRKRQGMVLVGETCEYHTREEGYGVSLG